MVQHPSRGRTEVAPSVVALAASFAIADEPEGAAFVRMAFVEHGCFMRRPVRDEPTYALVALASLVSAILIKAVFASRAGPLRPVTGAILAAVIIALTFSLAVFDAAPPTTLVARGLTITRRERGQRRRGRGVELGARCGARGPATDGPTVVGAPHGRVVAAGGPVSGHETGLFPVDTGALVVIDLDGFATGCGLAASDADASGRNAVTKSLLGFHIARITVVLRLGLFTTIGWNRERNFRTKVQV